MTNAATSLAAALAAAALLTLGGWWSRWAHRAQVARVVGALCFAGAAWVWTERWLTAGHLPLFGTYEAGLSLALVIVAVALIAELRFAAGVGALPVALATAAAVLVHAARYDPTPWALTISERSVWVELHAWAAWAAFGLYTLSLGHALRLLVRSDAGDDDGPLTAALHRGFVCHSLMIALGSFYAFLLFGRAWSFDPVETLALVSWATYATILHLRFFAGWRGRRLAAWTLFAFVILVLSYKGVLGYPGWSTYHVFDLNLRTHVVR